MISMIGILPDLYLNGYDNLREALVKITYVSLANVSPNFTNTSRGQLHQKTKKENSTKMKTVGLE